MFEVRGYFTPSIAFIDMEEESMNVFAFMTSYVEFSKNN